MTDVTNAKSTDGDHPFNNVSIVKAKAPENEIIQVGPIRLEVLEDGRNTDNRLGSVFIYVPPMTKGPAQARLSTSADMNIKLTGASTGSKDNYGLRSH